MTNIKTRILNYKYIHTSLFDTTMQHQILNKENFYDRTQYIWVSIDTFIFNLPFWDGSIYAV